MRWRAGCAQLLLQVDATALTQEAERLLGSPVQSPITFGTLVEESRAATAAWVRKLRTCFELAEKDAIFSPGQAATQLRVERELIGDFLRSQPSNISAALGTAASTVANRHLRRAVRFIQANLCNAITLADIAEASGTAPRSLQLYFQSEFDMSPMRYLKQQRLMLAQRLILHSQGRLALGDIAFRAGFSHFGRFSAEYRKQFGEPPRRTKERAMGQVPFRQFKGSQSLTSLLCAGNKETHAYAACLAKPANAVRPVQSVIITDQRLRNRLGLIFFLRLEVFFQVGVSANFHAIDEHKWRCGDMVLVFESVRFTTGSQDVLFYFDSFHGATDLALLCHSRRCSRANPCDRERPWSFGWSLHFQWDVGYGQLMCKV